MENQEIKCPVCNYIIPSEIIEKLTTGEYENCPECNYILKGEDLGLTVTKTEEDASIIQKLAKAAAEKKKRQLKAYYCPFCNHPSSRLTENQLNLLEMGMVVECKNCGESIKQSDLKL